MKHVNRKQKIITNNNFFITIIDILTINAYYLLI